MSHQRDLLFNKLGVEGLALAYSDIRLRSAYSDVMPNDANLESKFSKNVGLKVPIVSSPMDTVTEFALAIEMAKLGGLGIIHKNLTIEEQAEQVARVKHYMHGLISRPITMHQDQTIREILSIADRKQYQFRSFLIVDSGNALVGVLTGDDFDYCENLDQPAREVMTRNVVTSGVGIGLEGAYRIMQTERHKLLPLVDSDKRILGLYTHADARRILRHSSTANNVDRNGQLLVGAAVGTGCDTLDRVAALCAEHVDVAVIDSAHGDSKPVYDTLALIKKRYPGLDVVVGNVSQPKSAASLCKAGADGIKIGQGPGSICTTRIIAGIGCPQATAVYSCASETAKYQVPACADGGIDFSGDIPIAIGLGADCVMLGKMLAGTEEAPGETILFEGRRWKSYRGMGSLGAMIDNAGSRERYGQRAGEKSQVVPEGVEGKVPYRGTLSEVFAQLEEGLRRGMGYTGSRTIFELQTNAEFDRLTSGGVSESHPRVSITRQAPNYLLE